MNSMPNQSVIDMLAQVLEEAKRGEVSSAVLLTMNGKDGHVGYWSRITKHEDAEAAPTHMERMQAQLRDVMNEAK